MIDAFQDITDKTISREQLKQLKKNNTSAVKLNDESTILTKWRMEMMSRSRSRPCSRRTHHRSRSWSRSRFRYNLRRSSRSRGRRARRRHSLSSITSSSASSIRRKRVRGCHIRYSKDDTSTKPADVSCCLAAAITHAPTQILPQVTRPSEPTQAATQATAPIPKETLVELAKDMSNGMEAKEVKELRERFRITFEDPAFTLNPPALDEWMSRRVKNLPNHKAVQTQ